MARPLIEINADEVFKLAEIGCTKEEVAKWFDCSVDTIERRFAGDFLKGRESLKQSLRRAQIQFAKKGNPTLLIWLGKQLLKQTDSPNDSELLAAIHDSLIKRTPEELLDLAKKVREDSKEKK